MLSIRIVSIDLPEVKSGKIVGTRLVNILLPEPDGPIIIRYLSPI